MQPLLYKLKERKEEILSAGVQKYKLQNCPAPAKGKKKKASKHNRHLHKMHTITLYCLPDLNKENAWDLEILLSASVSQLSWSVKGGDGICTVATVYGLCQTPSHLLQ